MTEPFYAVEDDPGCYAGSDALKNRAGLRDAADLAEYEAISFALKALSPLPAGRFGVGHYKAVHRYLFGDVYRWAGRYRTIRIGKGAAVFCYPEHIPAQMRQLFVQLRADHHLRGLGREAFADKATAFLAWLNQIHPFREGNGRTQMAFTAALASHAGHPMDIAALDEAAFLDAMIRSFHGDEAPLRAQLLAIIA